MRKFLISALVFYPIGMGVVSAGDLPKLANFHQYDENTYSSEQPLKDDFAALAGAGVKVVVNLAPAELRASLKDEQALVEAQGMAYHYIPLGWKDPSFDDIQRFYEVLDSHKGAKILVHCWVNARASAAMFLYRVGKQNKPEDEETAVLYSIWEKNKGYELQNVPQWEKFIKKALQDTQ